MEEMYSSVDINEGDTINVFHCREGSNNDRCYITRDTDVVLFYCHHCGKRGGLFQKYSKALNYKARESNSQTSGRTHRPTMPSDVVYTQQAWPLRGQLWLRRGGITPLECTERGIGYSPRMGRVVIPVSYGGEFQGYVARGLEDDGPKYLVKYKNRDSFIYHIDRGTKDVVIVEDILSCIRVGRHKSCVAMLGATVSDCLFHLLVSKYDGYTIWSDYDNPQVKMQAHKLQQRLAPFGKVDMIVSKSDPKELTDEEIKECLGLK